MARIEIFHEGEFKEFDNVKTAQKKQFDTDAYGEALYEIRLTYTTEVDADADEDKYPSRLRSAEIIGVYVDED